MPSYSKWSCLRHSVYLIASRAHSDGLLLTPQRQPKVGGEVPHPGGGARAGRPLCRQGMPCLSLRVRSCLFSLGVATAAAALALLSPCAQYQWQEWDNFGSPHLGVARIAGEEVANGVPIEKRWLRLKHRTGRPSNFGKARLLVSVDFDPVGPVRC